LNLFLVVDGFPGRRQADFGGVKGLHFYAWLFYRKVVCFRVARDSPGMGLGLMFRQISKKGEREPLEHFHK
jgi:hypothetical protein